MAGMGLLYYALDVVGDCDEEEKSCVHTDETTFVPAQPISNKSPLFHRDDM